jgi:hypothetical protein
MSILIRNTPKQVTCPKSLNTFYDPTPFGVLFAILGQQYFSIFSL